MNCEKQSNKMFISLLKFIDPEKSNLKFESLQTAMDRHEGNDHQKVSNWSQTVMANRLLVKKIELFLHWVTLPRQKAFSIPKSCLSP